nr:hypothetical protein AOSUZXEW_AOSUZXEW_CDS_0010 [Microvirus sp.]
MKHSTAITVARKANFSRQDFLNDVVVSVSYRNVQYTVTVWDLERLELCVSSSQSKDIVCRSELFDVDSVPPLSVATARNVVSLALNLPLTYDDETATDVSPLIRFKGLLWFVHFVPNTSKVEYIMDFSHGLVFYPRSLLHPFDAPLPCLCNDIDFYGDHRL